MDSNKVEKALREFTRKFNKEQFIFCAHKHADVDAVTSAYVVSTFFPNSIFAIADELNSAAQSLLKHFNIKPVILKNALKKYRDAKVIAVDTSSKTLFPYNEILEQKREIFAVIDHHQRGKDVFEVKHMFVDTDARACAEIIANTFQKVNEKQAALLACGILSDTERFATSREKTMEAFIRVYKASKLSYEELIKLAFPEKPLSEKIAVITGLQRTKMIKQGKRIISLSHVGSNNGETASILARAGDIAFVAQKEDNAVRVSARANIHVDIELNKIMEEVASKFNGSGGGHKKAAGLIAYGDMDKVLDYCAFVTKKELEKKKR